MNKGIIKHNRLDTAYTYVYSWKYMVLQIINVILQHNTISCTPRFTPFTAILFVCLFSKCSGINGFLLKVLYTFLFVALSPGAALAYSGCEGSFSTNNLIPNRDTQLTIPVQDT